jgi:alcohol dehydrogenase
VHFGRHREKLRISQAKGADIRLTDRAQPRAAFAFVVDATGSPDGLRAAVAMTRPRGTVILKSTVHGLVSVDTAPVIVNEITLVGSRCGRMAPALALLKSGKIDPAAMVSARFPLTDAPRAFAHAAKKGVLKVLLYPPE